MSRIKTVVIGFALFIGIALFGYEEGQVVETVLPNGLKVLTVEMHNSPIIYHNITYKVGSRNDSYGLSGIAHVTEHMMFKGTRTYGKGKIAKLIKDNGGVFNAITDYDRTSYFMQLPKNRIELALSIESDRMQNCMIDSEEFALEREVVKEERRMRYEDSPRNLLSEEVRAVAYKCHPYHWPVIGWMSDIERITRQDVWNHYKTYYTPNNAVLVVTGDFETEEMLKLIKKYYENIPRGPDIVNRAPQEEKQTSERRVIKKSKHAKAPQLCMVFHIPELGHPDFPPFRIAARVLSAGSTSRLHKKLKQTGLVRNLTCKCESKKDPGLFTITAEILPNIPVEKVEELVWEELDALKEVPPTDREMKKIKNKIVYGEVFENQTPSEVGSRLASYEAKYMWEYVEQWKEDIKNVTANDVQRVLKDYINRNNVTVGILLPSGESEIKSGYLDEMGTNEFYLNDAYDGCYYKSTDIAISLPLMAKTSKIPQFDEAFVTPNPLTPRVKKAALDNGIKIYYIEDHTIPAVTFSGKILHGYVVEEESLPGISQLTGKTLDKETKNMSYEDITEAEAFLPISFNFSNGVESADFSGTALTESFDTLLAIVSDILQNPTFPENKIEITKDGTIALIKRNEGTPGHESSHYVFQNVYKDHPYGWRSIGTEESIEKIDREDLLKYHQKYYRPELTTICATGDLAFDEFVSKFSEHFGEWVNDTKFEFIPIEEPEQLQGVNQKIFAIPGKKQVAIKIGMQAPPHNSPDYLAFDVANYILGGSSLTARLGKNIRDKKGLAYSVSSKFRSRRRGGIWVMSAGTSPEKVRDLVSSTLLEIERIVEDGITEEELDDVRTYFLGLFSMAFQTPRDIMENMKECVWYKLELDWWDRYPDMLKALTVDDINRVIRKYLNTNNMVVAIAGDVDEDVLEGILHP